MVGQRAEEDLAGRKSYEIDADDKLPVVLVTDAKRIADLRQRREHDIDRERRQRHKKRDQRHELDERQRELSRLRRGSLRLYKHEAGMIPRAGPED